ncbi:hypothetical protein PIB30_036552 [Stylosanthes scabra]|uniref:Uncharacterized protein n=1 Tax=Stylosanthes scabra TaxID=79078 RepID=A0ABU6VEN0_9FABA|nr:hypothetical protein [Stylosanthes scabra]
MSSSFSNSYRRFMLIAVVMMLVILIGSPKYGEAWRPLLRDGILNQMLPKGSSNPSKGDPTSGHASAKFGEAWRPLKEEDYNGVLMQMLPKSPPNPSKGDPING